MKSYEDHERAALSTYAAHHGTLTAGHRIAARLQAAINHAMTMELAMGVEIDNNLALEGVCNGFCCILAMIEENLGAAVSEGTLKQTCENWMQRNGLA